MIACYALVAVVLAPAIIEFGVDPLQAHLFVYYFAAMSFVTPPVAIGAFTAASIARAPLMKTALYSTRLSIAAYIVPFAFIYHPQLLFSGSMTEIAIHSVSLGD